MASQQPFLPAVKSGAAGLTQSIALAGGAATSQTIQIPASTSNGNNAVLVSAFNNNAANSSEIIAYVRLSVEASTSITATATDTPVIIPPQSGTVRLFASPNMVGAYNIAVIVTVTPSVAGSFISFSPGQGGI